MSNSTEVVVSPRAPANAPSPAPLSPSPAYSLPSPVQSPGGPALATSKSQSSFSISWFGIAGILAAFVVLAIIALVCFWHKRNAYRKALQDQRNFYIQNAASQIRDDSSGDEEQSRAKRSQMTLVDWALPDWAPIRSNGELNPFFGESPTSGERIVEEDIPVYTRVPKPPRGFRGKIVPGSFRDKHMNHRGSTPGSPVGEVFYTGEEGSQMGAFRFSRAEVGSIEILTRVFTPKKRKAAESESASLLGNLNRAHTIAATPTREDRNKLGGSWKLRTFNSLPAYHRKPPPESVLTSWGLRGESRVELGQSKPMIRPLTPQPSSLRASPAPPSAHGNSLTPAAWARTPSRLSVQSSAVLHSPTFIVPPSTPPRPLPLPVTVDEADGQEKTLKDLRRELKQAESKWTIAPYCPSAPPPPLPVPFQAPAPPPRRSPLGLGSLPDVHSPPPFRVLPFQAPAPPPPPPPPLPPRRSGTLPPKLLVGDGGRSDPPPPPPPPSPPSLPTLPGKKFTPRPSPPPFPSPRPSPPPPPLPVSGLGKGPGSASRPKLTPLLLPGRPDLGEDLQDFRTEHRSSKRHQKMRPLHWDKLKPDSDRTVWDNIRNSMELDEEMIQNLFGVNSRATSSGVKRLASVATSDEKYEILDPRKAHNIAIQIRARGLSRVEVCDALIEGDDLGQETLELLVKMSPTDEESTKFQEYQGDPSLLGPADRFILGILQIPNAFERLDAMLYRASFEEELQHIQDTIITLEMACKELRGSRTFTKLLEAVLKTGNRLNMGTFRGDAKAFKLDTLLKLADVKGVDGKTTLLHFVIKEIIKAEGARAARLAGFYDAATPTSIQSSACTTPSSASPTSPLSQFARTMEAELERCQNIEVSMSDSKDDFRKIGMDVVRGIPTELDHVRKAGGLDILALRLSVSRLHSGLENMKATLEKLRVSSDEIVIENRTTTFELTNDVFRERMLAFANEAEAEVGVVQRDLDIVLASVKDISIYFYGEADTAKSTQPLKVFVVMREFLAMLEQACKDVMTTDGPVVTQLQTSSRRPSLK